MSDLFAALKSAKENGSDTREFFAQKLPVCPHCGFETQDMSDQWFAYEEGQHSLVCGSCDADFTVSTSVVYGFSTDDLPLEQS